MCPICGTPFGKRRRCYKCAPGRRKTGSTKPCAQCGKPFYVSLFESRDIARNSGTYCSRACLHASMRLDGPGAKFKRPDGYVVVYYPKHPDAGGRRMVLEHRLVMEQTLGRRLRKDEQVNHINHVRDDNRPENLQVISASAHARESNAWGVENRRRLRERLKALEIEVAEYHRRYGPLT